MQAKKSQRVWQEEVTGRANGWFKVGGKGHGCRQDPDGGCGSNGWRDNGLGGIKEEEWADEQMSDGPR